MQVEIRPLEEKDALISYKWRNNPLIWKYTGNRPDKTITPEIELDWIRKVLKNENEKRFAIIADSIYVGNVYLTNVENHTASFHIFIGESDYWGKGVATIVLDKIISYSNKIHLSKLILKVHQDNISAQKLYKKAGFVETSREGDRVSMEKIL